MDYQSLAAEIENDPQNLGYSPHVLSGADMTIAGIMNLPRYTILGAASLDSVQAYVQAHIAADSAETGKDIYMRVDEIANDPNHALYVPCKAAIQLFEKARYQAVDLSLDRPAELLNVLRLGGIITQAQQDHIIDIGTKQISRAEQLFGASVSHLDIAKALRG